MNAPIFRRHSDLTWQFLLSLFVVASLMVGDLKFKNVHLLRHYLLSVTTPLVYFTQLPVVSYTALRDSLSSHEQLRKDNAELRADLMILQFKLQTYYSLQQENQQLHALLDSVNARGGQFKAAKLLRVEVHPYRHVILIDKGSKDAVYVGQPVFDAFGVIGQVIEVGVRTAKVMLISDQDSAVPVQLLRSGQRGILSGRGEMDRLALINFPQTVDVAVGDQLVTSGLGQGYPAGYAVGQVTAVKHIPGERFATIDVAPASQLNRSRLVLLAWLDS